MFTTVCFTALLSDQNTFYGIASGVAVTWSHLGCLVCLTK